MGWKKWRERAGLTQEDVANILQISRAHYSRIESGKRSITLGVARQLADLMHLSPHERVEILSTSPAPSLEGLPLHLDGQAVHVLELHQDPDGTWWALVQPSSSPTATARRIPVAGLALLPLPAVRAA